MNSLGHSIADLYRKVASTFTSASGDSHFRTAGTLTSEEFVEAGEQLVRRCPTWAWQSSTPGYEQTHLPIDKQFLITRGVPCRRRAVRSEVEIVEHITDEGWVVTEFVGQDEEPIDMPDLRDSCEDREDEEEDIDPNALPSIFTKDYVSMEAPTEHILKTRVYDLSITYDKYYQTPRLWLSGYDEFHSPLTIELMFQDIMDDYAGKTVTMDTHPCLSNSQLSVHPCNHAQMMKHFVDIIEAAGSQAEVRAYLFVFLKFLASVVPTIEYDFTTNFELA
jgi:ubiquitin-like-conjugating enzyme ATG3